MLTVEGPIEAAARQRTEEERKRKMAKAPTTLMEGKVELAIISMDKALRQAEKSGGHAARFDIGFSEATQVSLKGPYALMDNICEIAMADLSEGTNPAWIFVFKLCQYYKEKDSDLAVKLFGYSSSYGNYKGKGGWHILISWE